MKRNEAEPKREVFGSRFGFIVACVGCGCGDGKYLDVSLQGTGSAPAVLSFLIPYFIFVAILGFSGVVGGNGLWACRETQDLRERSAV